MTTIKAPPKECEQCGHLFYHDPRKTYEEWVTRRFCSRDCLLNFRATLVVVAQLAFIHAAKILASGERSIDAQEESERIVSKYFEGIE